MLAANPRLQLELLVLEIPGNAKRHGTDQVGRLGTPASSGCIRLHPENAEVLFAMVEQVNKSDFAVRVIE